MYSFLSAVERVIVKVEHGLMLCMAFVITFSIFAMVLLRYVFKIPLFGTEEIALVAAYWLYFVGAGITTHRDAHIKAEVFKEFIKGESSVRRIKLLQISISIIICLILAYHTLQYALWTHSAQMVSSYYQIPLVVPRMSLFIGFMLMVFHLTVQLCRYCRKGSSTLREENLKDELDGG